MVLASVTALKALWSPSAEAKRLVASANPACRKYISQQIPTRTCLTLAILRPQLTTPLVRSRLSHSPTMRMTRPTAPSSGLYPCRVQNLIFPWSYAARLRSVARPGSARHRCGGDSAYAAVPRRSGGCDGRPRSRVIIFRVCETARCWSCLRTAARKSRM